MLRIRAAVSRPFLLLLAALAGCATPIAPTGGPADTTPPALVGTLPADGATNVTDRTITLTFSERLASEAGGAVVVTPAGDVPPEVTVRAREVTITLPELRDSTTYVVTVGTELRDQRSVALRQPITVAFSTGDRIDGGVLEGQVRAPATGGGVGGLAVWAYPLADSTAPPNPREIAPSYRTETGADGAFRLSYLRPGRYFVAAVADRNRNGRADPGERFAAPPRAGLTVDTVASQPVALWVTTRDTIPPVAQRIRPVSDRRFSVRFSEPVRLRNPALLSLADSASGAAVATDVRLYQPPASPFEVFVEAGRSLPSSRLLVTAAAGLAADSAGVETEAVRLSFTPPARADTVRARIVSFVPTGLDSLGTLRRGERPGVRFSSPPSQAQLDALALTVDGEPQPATFRSADGLTVLVDTLTALPDRFVLRLVTPDSTYRQRYSTPGDRDTGAIVGRVDSDGPAFVEARPEAGPAVLVAADATGAFTIDGLLPGPYLVRVWVDRDGDGQWSGGSLAPYLPPEPLVLLAEPAQVRARWETELDPIRL